MNTLLEPLVAELKRLEEPFDTPYGVYRVQVVNLAVDDPGGAVVSFPILVHACGPASSLL
jgi:hypothetical protein